MPLGIETFVDCNSLDEILVRTLSLLGKQVTMGKEVHYVAGVISSDGDAHIERNMQELLRHRSTIAQELGEKALVFTSPDIFTPALLAQLNVFSLPKEVREQGFRAFWDGVISSGLVSHVHFTFGWERSKGAQFEHEAVQKLGVGVTYLPGDA